MKKFLLLAASDALLVYALIDYFLLQGNILSLGVLTGTATCLFGWALVTPMQKVERTDLFFASVMLLIIGYLAHLMPRGILFVVTIVILIIWAAAYALPTLMMKLECRENKG